MGGARRGKGTLRREASEAVSLSVQSPDSRAIKLLDRALELYGELVGDGDDFVDIHNWGLAHLLRARRTEGEAARASYSEAKRLFLRAEELAEGIAVYSLAGVCAALGEEDECRRWFERALAADMLPERVDIVCDPEFAGVLDRDWFLAVLDALPAPDEDAGEFEEPGFRPGPGFPGVSL